MEPLQHPLQDSGDISTEEGAEKNGRAMGKWTEPRLPSHSMVAVVPLNSQQLSLLTQDWAHRYLVTEQGSAHEALSLHGDCIQLMVARKRTNNSSCCSQW